MERGKERGKERGSDMENNSRGLTKYVFRCLIKTLFLFLVFMSYNDAQQNKRVTVRVVLLYKQ